MMLPLLILRVSHLDKLGGSLTFLRLFVHQVPILGADLLITSEWHTVHWVNSFTLMEVHVDILHKQVHVIE